MNKKFLSVVLFGAMIAGSSVTFTGCIDNDEPEGITNLRGAKAELIKAKAAVELANEAMVRAQVANQELLNKAQELKNRYAEIDVQIHEFDIQIKQAATAAEVAKYEQQKQYWENQKALEAEAFKKDLLDAQAKTAQAQLDYENVLKAIELAKLTLSKQELDVLGAVQKQVTDAQESLTGSYAALQAAQKALNASYETTAVTDTKEGLELEIEQKELALEIANQGLKTIEEIVAKNISTFEGWEAETKDLELKIAVQDTILAKANIEKVKIQESTAGKESAAALTKANTAQTTAQTKRDNAYAGSTVDSKSYTFKLDKWSKDVTSNKALVEVLNATNVGDVVTTAYSVGVFSYVAESYNQNSYVAQKGTSTEKALDEMLALVNAVPGRAAEDLAWVNLTLEQKKKALTTATETYNKRLEEWKKAVADYKEGKTYTLTSFTLAKDNMIGVLGAIKAGDYKDEATQKAAYEAYITFRSTMTDNKQINQPASLPASVKDYATLKAAIGSANVETFVPAGYTPVDPIAALETASKNAFGDIYKFDKTNPRLTEPTATEIAVEQAKIAKGEKAYANYAAIGAVWENQAEVTYYEQIIAQADAIKELKAALEAQKTAVTAKIAENTTAVKAFDTALDAAKAEVKAKKAADDALYAEVNKTITTANATKVSLQTIKAAITKEMTAITSDPSITSVDDVKNALAKKVIEAKEAVVEAEVALKDAKTVLADFEAGKYNKQYELDRLTALLVYAQARYDEALIIYNESVANLNKVLETLTK